MMISASPNRLANRTEAGQLLATELWRVHSDVKRVVVLGLPRGGVPVAAAVADRFGAPLDVVVVRKVGVPGQQELAMGAVASGGVVIRNQDVLEEAAIGERLFQRTVDTAETALKQLETEFRGDRDFPPIEGNNVILVDDGLATGSTMKAAIAALREFHPDSVTVAVPVSPKDTLADIRRIADHVVCLLVPKRFLAVAIWYRDFPQVSTGEVRRILDEHATHGSNRLSTDG